MKARYMWRGAVAAAAASAVLLGACVGTGVDTLDEFRSAIDGGADCAQLFEMRGNFEDSGDLERIDAELDELGCAGPDSTRDDR